MIPYADLLKVPWSRDSLSLDRGSLSCLGVSLLLLARHGIPSPEQAPNGSRADTAPDRLGAPRSDAPAGTDNRPRAQPSAATLQAEATLAAWAAASPWETLDPSVAAQPEVGDVFLLDGSDTSPAGLAVVVCDRQRLAVTSMPGRGVVALRVSALRPILQAVYRWGAA